MAKVAGKRANGAKILHQDPDRRIGWQSTDGKQTTGTVTFEPIGDERTRIRLAMTYTPEGPLERAGSAVGLDNRRIRGDLERFKVIEGRGAEAAPGAARSRAARRRPPPGRLTRAYGARLLGAGPLWPGREARERTPRAPRVPSAAGRRLEPPPAPRNQVRLEAVA